MYLFLWNSADVNGAPSEHGRFLIPYSLCIWCKALGATPGEPGSSKQPCVMLANHKKNRLMTHFLVRLCSKFTQTFPLLALDGALTACSISLSDRSFDQVRTMPSIGQQFLMLGRQGQLRNQMELG